MVLGDRAVPFGWRGPPKRLGASPILHGRGRQQNLRVAVEDATHRAPTSTIFASRPLSKDLEGTQVCLPVGEVEAAAEAAEGRLGEALELALEEEALECFQLFDRDADGLVQATEVVDMLRSLGFILTHEQAKAIKADMRVKNIAMMNLSTFKWVLRQGFPRILDPVEVLKAFYVMDRQNKGSVNVEELHHLMTSVGDRLTEEDWRTLLKISVPPRENQNPVAFKSETFQKLFCGPIEGETACAMTAAFRQTPAPDYKDLR